jgi:integrase
LLENVTKPNKIKHMTNTTNSSEQTPNNQLWSNKTPQSATVLLRTGNPTEPSRTTPKKCSVTVTQVQVRGELKWQVRYWDAANGRPGRLFRDSKTEADAIAAEKRSDELTNRKKLSLLSHQDADTLMLIHSECQRRGIALPRVLGLLDGAALEVKTCPSIKKVVGELIAIKEFANRDEDYIKNLKGSYAQFIRGREEMPIDQFTTAIINKYMVPMSAPYKKTLLPKLSMLFKYAKDKEYIRTNPCTGITDISYTAPPPAVFKVDVARQCLEWFTKKPKALGWFINTAFCGLRPEDEACGTEWDQIHADESRIVVDGALVKTGDRRVVRPPAMVFDWYKWAKENGAVLPLTVGQMRYQRDLLKEHLGWTEWPTDITRHSAASYWLAITNDVKLVSRSLGNSISILESTYDARVFANDGLKYYGLTPAALGLM